VLLIGTGLTMVDTGISLLDRGHTGKIHALSRRGLLPATPCWKRIQKLEGKRVITRRMAVVDPDRVGVGLSVFVAVEAGEPRPSGCPGSALRSPRYPR
jgi:Lrp/AsnC family transcriptional regulator